MSELYVRAGNQELLFITAVPNTKLCAWGEEGVKVAGYPGPSLVLHTLLTLAVTEPGHGLVLARKSGSRLSLRRATAEGSERESVLFICTRFSNLYIAVDTPAEAA